MFKILLLYDTNQGAGHHDGWTGTQFEGPHSAPHFRRRAAPVEYLPTLRVLARLRGILASINEPLPSMSCGNGSTMEVVCDRVVGTGLVAPRIRQHPSYCVSDPDDAIGGAAGLLFATALGSPPRHRAVAPPAA